MTAYTDIKLFIDGDWRDGVEGQKLPIIDPATEEEIGQLSCATKPDLDITLDAAQRGFETFRDRHLAGGAAIFRKVQHIPGAQGTTAVAAKLAQGKGAA